MTDVGLFLCSTAARFIAIFTGVNLCVQGAGAKDDLHHHVQTDFSEPIHLRQVSWTGADHVHFGGGDGQRTMRRPLYGGVATQRVHDHRHLPPSFLEVTIVLSVAILFSSFSTPFCPG